MNLSELQRTQTLIIKLLYKILKNVLNENIS